MHQDIHPSTPVPSRRRPWIRYAALTLVLGFGAVFAFVGCAAVVPNRTPVGEPFVSVRGEALDGTELRVPADFSAGGGPLVLLIGYVQEAQFDLDRWLIGLGQLKTPAKVLELPTIRGMIPGMISGTIDSGMRSGIPEEDWGVVVTLYGEDAARVVEQFGNEKPRNGRIVLVDGAGTIRWIHDRGFSATKVQELDAAVRALL